MSKIIDSSLNTIAKGLESLKNIKRDKDEYKVYLERIKALPDEYRFVYDKATEYMWSYSGGGDGYDMISLHANLLELFEISAASSKSVLEVTGTDVASFCDELLRNAITYTEKRRDKLNREIRERLGGSNGAGKRLR